jgi:hypothetical protein
LSMIPVTERDYQLSAVDYVFIRGSPWLDDHGTAEAVDYLGLVVRVPPVCSYLVDLSASG